MNFSNYTSGFDKDPSCSYYFFSNDDQSAATSVKDQLHRDMKESLSKSFGSLSTYWCYILITDDLKNLVNPAIIHKETKEPFNGPETIWINRMGSVQAFFSTTPILDMEQPGNTFQLIERHEAFPLQHKVVIPSLPGPDYNHIAPLNTISEYIGENFTFIFI